MQTSIFLNQTLRSKSPGRIAGFVIGIVLILFWWLNVGALTIATMATPFAPRVAAPVATILSLAFLVYTGVLLFTSLLFSLNALLLNPDLDLLLAAPRPVESVLAARMVVQVLRMLLLSLLLTAPALVLPSLTGHPAVLPGFVLLFLLYPVLPVVLVSVITLALVRFIPAGRGKEVIAVLGITIGLVINIINFLVNPALRGSGVRRFSTPGLVTGPLLPWSWAGRLASALLRDDVIAALTWGTVLLVASAAAFALAVLASGRLYRAGWIQTVPRRQRRAATVRRRPGLALPGLDPVVAAIVAKDWRMRTRDLAQLIRFVMPVAFLLFLLAFRARALMPSAVLSAGPGPLPALAGLVPSWLLLLSLSGALGLSAVSLEGRAIWIYAASPNQIGRLLYAKCWASGLPVLVLTVAIAIGMEALIHPGWPWAAAAVAILAVQSGAVVALMVAIGGFWARFDWTDARRMMHPAAGIVGVTTQFAITGVTTLLAAGSVFLAGFLHAELLPMFLTALGVAALGGILVAYAGLVLATYRLRSLDVA